MVLDLKPYKKPTNPQNFLHRDSCHPLLRFVNIVRGEFLRILRVSSDMETFATAIEKVGTLHGEGLLLELPHGSSQQNYVRPTTSGTRWQGEGETVVFSVQQHPVVPSSAIREAIFNPDLPFQLLITRPKTTWSGLKFQKLEVMTEQTLAQNHQMMATKTDEQLVFISFPKNIILLPPCRVSYRIFC